MLVVFDKNHNHYVFFRFVLFLQWSAFLLCFFFVCFSLICYRMSFIIKSWMDIFRVVVGFLLSILIYSEDVFFVRFVESLWSISLIVTNKSYEWVWIFFISINVSLLKLMRMWIKQSCNLLRLTFTVDKTQNLFRLPTV